MFHLLHPYMTTGKTKALTVWTFVDQVMSVLFNMLSRFVITFFPKSKRLLVNGCSHRTVHLFKVDDSVDSQSREP